MVRAYESYYDSKLREQFSGIPGLVVGVHVEPNIDKVSEEQYKVDPNEVIPGGIETRQTESSTAGGGGEVGVRPNTGEGALPGGGRTVSDTTSEENVLPAVAYSRSTILTEKMPGEVKGIKAAINIPRSYLVDVARLRTEGDSGAGPEDEGQGEGAGAAEPEVDEAAVQSVFESEKAKISKQAMNVLGAETEEAISVDWYYDVESDVIAASAGPGVAGGIFGGLKQYGPSAALGVLGLLALLMVYGVVRKIQPAAVPTEMEPDEQEADDAGLSLDSILEGVELEAGKHHRERIVLKVSTSRTVSPVT